MTNNGAPLPMIRGLSRVAIGGCGRTGASIATALCRPGRTVHILGTSVDAFDHLPRDIVRGGLLIPYLADITLESDLRKTGVQDTDVFIATAGSDPVNIMAAQIALHILDVKSVVCRLDDPVKRELYEGLNITTISHTEILRDLALEQL